MPEKAWEAGDDYFMAANAILAQEDLGLSRLTTVQGLLLMAYREVGMGAMARSWAYVPSLCFANGQWLIVGQACRYGCAFL